MAVRIAEVGAGSRFFRAGDEILSIDGTPVEDQLDIHFRTAGAGRALFSIRRRDGSERSRVLSLRSFHRAGLTFEAMRFRRCRGHCIFCFVDQMPPGLRAPLYEKDDDYRLSFLYGNYITLNDIGPRDIDRIERLGLTPLYVSVHAVDRRVRERLFGKRLSGDIRKTIERLVRGGVTIHAQVVLVPGLNDGGVLDETVDALAASYPSVRSLAVVPVGLTGHRAGLPAIRAVTGRNARALIRWAEKRRRALQAGAGANDFLYLSDEWYLLANHELPPHESYGEFWQLANGVGMCRRFVEAVKRDIARLRRRPMRFEPTIVTGVLGARFLRRYVIPLVRSELPGCNPRLLVVRNRLFGAGVTVSGLIAGRDIIAAFRRRAVPSDCIVLPPNALNHDGLLIDDLTPRDIERSLGTRTVAAASTFLERRIVRSCGGETR